MNEFNDYLKKVQYMEWDPKRFQQARKDGIIDDPKNAVSEEIPLWLLNDMIGYVNQNFINKFNKYSNLEKKKMLIYYAEKKLKITNNIIPKNSRYVVTSKGDIFSGSSDDTIHQQIISYAMLKGKIPVDPKLRDYKWSEIETYDYALNHFICLEETYGRVVLAESYSAKDLGAKILSYLKELPKNHPYIKKSSEIGIFYPKTLGQE